MKKKSSFTLLEVMISFFLLSTILTAFFFSYRLIAKEKRGEKELLQKVKEERYCHIRLKSILGKVMKDLPFYTDSRGDLVFIFDHGIDPDPLFSKGVFASLYLDKKANTLCYSIAPQDKSKAEKHFILLGGVKKMDLLFYYPPVNTKIVNPEEVGKSSPKVGWQGNWSENYEELPTFIKLLIEREGRNLVFTFPIQEGKKAITYRQGF